MAVVNSIRDFHSELTNVCDSLESVFRLAGDAYSDLSIAAGPAMQNFRELLDAGDVIVGVDCD